MDHPIHRQLPDREAPPCTPVMAVAGSAVVILLATAAIAPVLVLSQLIAVLLVGALALLYAARMPQLWDRGVWPDPDGAPQAPLTACQDGPAGGAGLLSAARSARTPQSDQGLLDARVGMYGQEPALAYRGRPLASAIARARPL